MLEAPIGILSMFGMALIVASGVIDRAGLGPDSEEPEDEATEVVL